MSKAGPTAACGHEQRQVARLIQCGQRLRRRYALGAMRVGEPGLRVLLDEHALTLAMMMKSWARLLVVAAPVPVVESLAERLIDWQVVGLRHDDARWIAYLVRCEERFLVKVERLAAATGEPCATLLRRDLPRLRGIDQDMHQLAHGERWQSP